MPGTRIEAALRAARNRGASTALVAFLTAGFPSREAFPSLLLSAAREADVVEIGVPFTDPMADGVTIQRSSRMALEQGTSLRWILEMLGGLPAAPGAPVVLMSYLNPLLAYGFDALARDATRAGVEGFIVPDLPLEESGDFGRALEGEGLALVQLVTPVTPDERRRRIAGRSRGFLYAVTTTGTTGGRALGVNGRVADYLAGLRAVSDVPVCAGFGVRTAEQVAALAPHVDGVIVGSALVEAVDGGRDPGEFLRGLHPSRSRESGA